MDSKLRIYVNAYSVEARKEQKALLDRLQVSKLMRINYTSTEMRFNNCFVIRIM